MGATLQPRSASILAIILAVYVFLAAWQAQTTYPWDNEAYFADPALNLLNSGFMGTTILESKGTWMEGLDRHTYWILPLHVLAQTAWYKVFGFSLLTLRWLSIVWGMVILVAWYALLHKFSKDVRIALLGVGLLAIDYHFTWVTSLGRMDAMCAGLGWAGCAAYACLHERNLRAAVLSSNVLVAASCFTHPCGVLYFALLSVLTLYYDRARLGWREVAVAASPYLFGAAAWGSYIAQSPAQFSSQFGGNASGIAGEFTEMNRWSGLKAPGAAFFWEIRRYLAVFDWYTATNIWMRSQVTILVLYAIGILAALATPSIRRHSGYRVLLLSGAVFFFLLALFEGLKSSTYIVHTLPLAAALLAVSASHYARGIQWTRWVAIAVLVAFVSLQLGYGLLQKWFPQDRLNYDATVEFLESHTLPSSKIVGGAELAFDLGFHANLVDDPRLGFYSGRQADFIVADPVYRGFFQRSKIQYPEIYEHIHRALEADYREVFENPAYTIYQRVVKGPN